MAITDKLSLPYIASLQAQKHITHNDALQKLDAIVQLSAIERTLSAPPATPNDGDSYIVASPATGEWLGKESNIAAFQNGAWEFYTPNEGWLAWVEAEDILLVFNGSTWELAGVDSINPAPLVGVNSTADTTNRLSVSSPNTLFSHEGADHRININKNASGDTASFLFQSNWSGRAEIGLTGDDNFHFKVSGDGSSWKESINIDAASGNIGINGTPQTGSGAMKINGALQVAMQANAFNTTSVYTAFIIGAPGSNGGLYAIARDNAANEPFTGLCGWDSGANRRLYFGGGGWQTPDATEQLFYTAPSATETNNQGVLRLRITAAGTTEPGADNAYNLGSATRRWSDIYAVNSVINTSDKRLKTDIKESDLGLDFINKLRPISYKWKIGSFKPVAGVQNETGEHGQSKEKYEEKAGQREHYGLIAQEVKQALDDVKCNNFAGWTLANKNESNSEQGLRYDELIAPLIKAVQELSAEIRQMKEAGRQQ